MPFEEVIGLQLKRIWADAKDIFVCHYVVYVNSDGVACVEPECVTPIGSQMLADLYSKSLLVSDNGVLYTPLSITKGSPTVSIVYAKVNSSGNFIPATVTSYEDVPFVDPVLTSLDVGGKTLTPAFDPDVLEYALTTTDVTNLLSFSVDSEDAEISVKLNGVAVADLETGLTWTSGENVLKITLAIEEVSTVYEITVTKEAPPSLATLDIGSKVLTPVFDPGVFEYSLTTTDATNIVTLTALPASAVVSVTLNGTAVTAGDLTTGLTWAAGENTLVITVTAFETDMVYTITVTKE